MSSDWQQEQASPGPDFVATAQVPPMGFGAPQIFPSQQTFPVQFASPYPQQYQQPPYPQQYQPGMAPMHQPMLPPGVTPIQVQTIPNHPLAISALITSVIFLINLLLPLGFIPLILGIIAHVLISKNPTRWRGKGLAKASIIIGALSTLISAIVITAMIFYS